MADQPQDGAPQPIMFSEAFHRAKRNVLWWALIAILVAVGSAGEVRSIEVDGVVKGLMYPHRFLIAGSVTVLAYNAIGYVRAALRVSSDHLAIAEMAKLRSGANAMERLSEQVGGVTDAIEHTQQSIRLIDQELAERDELRTLQPSNVQESIKRIMSVVSHVEDVPGQLPRTVFKNDPAGVLPIVNQIFAEGADAGWNLLSSTRAKLASSLDVQTRALPSDDTMRGIVEAIDLAKRELGKLVDTISRGQRLWLNLYDHGAVALACTVAIAASAWSWEDAPGFDTFIDQRFSAQEIAQTPRPTK